jgi:hypothetical protein
MTRQGGAGPRVARLGILGLLAAAMTACGGASGSVPRASTLALLPERGLQLVRAGIPGPLPSVVPIAADLVPGFTVTDGDPAYERTLEIALRRGDDAAAQPVDDATIAVHAEMVLMDHDPFDATAQAVGEGAYRVTLPFTMAGEWQLELVVATPTETGGVDLALDVFD